MHGGAFDACYAPYTVFRVLAIELKFIDSIFLHVGSRIHVSLKATFEHLR